MSESKGFWETWKAQPEFISKATFASTLFLNNFDDLNTLNPEVIILGVPLEWGECSAGQSFGPGCIRALAAMNSFETYNVELGIDPFATLRIADYGDVPGVSRSNVEEAFHATTQKVLDILRVGAIPLVIGGDHSITYPILRAYCEHFKGNVGLIHFDAHLDTRDRYGSEKYSCASWLRRSIEDFANLKGKNYTMIGARGFWPNEGDDKWMEDQAMKVFRMIDVEERGIEACVDTALERAWDGTEAVFLTFDGDAIDPSYAPALGMPMPGGLTSLQAIRAMRKIMRHGVSGMDLVEMTPHGENEAQTSTYLAVLLIMEALSGIALKRGTDDKSVR